MSDFDYETDVENEYQEEELSTEIEEERKLEIIYNFKNYISKSPSFIGINNISSMEILNLFLLRRNSHNYNYKQILYQDDLYFFDILHNDLFGFSNDATYYNIVAQKIMQKIYV